MARLLPLAAVAALALTVGACAGPSAETSSAGGSAEATARDGTGDAKAGGEKKLPWWRLSQYSRGPAYETPEERDRKRPGLFSGKEGGFVLYRQGEAGRSADPTKPAKVRR
ncbi:MAG: hypothetical protein OXF89_10360 [Rhodospirillaceae bacterium]|nr:hypothetical protein [Rhodospirillaceae bacterium]